MTTKTTIIKVKDIFDAIEKNGYPWFRDIYVSANDDGEVVGACAIGQASLNLKTHFYYIRSALNELVTDEEGYNIRLSGAIEDYNDRSASSYQDVVNYARQVLEPYFDQDIELEGYGAYHNDD